MRRFVCIFLKSFSYLQRKNTKPKGVSDYKKKRFNMSLIKCPECGKEISDKAVACPQCGFPIGNNMDNTSISTEEVVVAESFPVFPTVINVGKQVVNWTMDAAVECFYEEEYNSVKYLKSGKGNIYVYTNGICIDLLYSKLLLSFDQIIDMRYSSYEKIISEKKSKSVLGRAAVGGVLFGPAGAVVGGLSGLGSTEITKKKLKTEAIAIEFWDVYTHTRQIVAVEVPFVNQGNRLIDRVMSDKQERKSNTTTGNNYICNIIDDNGQLDESKVIEALKVVGVQNLAQELQKAKNCGYGEAESTIKRIGQKNNVDASSFQSAGCLPSLLLVTFAGLCSLFFVL